MYLFKIRWFPLYACTTPEFLCKRLPLCSDSASHTILSLRSQIRTTIKLLSNARKEGGLHK